MVEETPAMLAKSSKGVALLLVLLLKLLLTYMLELDPRLGLS
jgi:hypothetical protein